MQDLYGIIEDEDAAEEARRNDDAANSEEEREQLRLQVGWLWLGCQDVREGANLLQLKGPWVGPVQYHSSFTGTKGL